MKHVLALDIATQTGWARVDGSRLTWGTIRLDSGEGPKPNYPYRWNEVLAVLDLRPTITRLVLERPAGRSGPASLLLNGAAAIAIHWAWCNEVPWSLISVAAWKKRGVGKGNCSREEYHRAAVERWGQEVRTQDEAAALWLLHYVGDLP